MHRQAGMENMKIRSELRAEIEMHARSKASFSPTPKTLNLPIPDKQIKKNPDDERQKTLRLRSRNAYSCGGYVA